MQPLTVVLLLAIVAPAISKVYYARALAYIECHGNPVSAPVEVVRANEKDAVHDDLITIQVKDGKFDATVHDKYFSKITTSNDTDPDYFLRIHHDCGCGQVYETRMIPRENHFDNEKEANDKPYNYGTVSLSLCTVAEIESKQKQAIGKVEEHVAIKLKRLYILNNIEMDLAEGDWSYWIAVSPDKEDWTHIINYSPYICRSTQRLYFKEQPIRYIRIHGAAPNNASFDISRFHAKNRPDSLEFDPETGIVIPSQNVASAELNAIVTHGGNPNAMITSSTFGILHTWTTTDNYIILQLPQPYMIGTLDIWLGEEDVYSYNIEVGVDRLHWALVVKEDQKVHSRQHDVFNKQPVVFIKITCKYSSREEKTCIVQQIKLPSKT
uniref:Signal peptide-containing protein n=1 Tax=Panagrellus redivivus TaxID=6233 RepID=A0A7E4W4L7_PANRE